MTSYNEYGYLIGSPLLQWPETGPLQQPRSFLNYSYIANAETQAGTDPLVRVELSIQPSGAGEMQASQLSVDGTTITVWLRGGVAGRNYLVQLLLVTASGETFEIPIGVSIDPIFGPQPPPAPPSNAFGAPVIWTRDPTDTGIYNVSTYGNAVYA